MEKRLLTTKDVLTVLGIGRTKLYEIINDPSEQFPQPVMTGWANRYDRKDIDQWIESKKLTRAS